MELPDTIVRDFSKPIFRFSREYEEAVLVLNRKEWPALKEMLYTDKADPIMKALKAYVNAVVAKQRADKEYDDYYFTGSLQNTRDMVQHWDELSEMRKECRDTRWFQRSMYRELMVLMYGEERVNWDTDTDDEGTDDEGTDDE